MHGTEIGSKGLSLAKDKGTIYWAFPYLKKPQCFWPEAAAERRLGQSHQEGWPFPLRLPNRNSSDEGQGRSLWFRAFVFQSLQEWNEKRRKTLFGAQHQLSPGAGHRHLQRGMFPLQAEFSICSVRSMDHETVQGTIAGIGTQIHNAGKLKPLRSEDCRKLDFAAELTARFTAPGQ